MTTSNKCGLLYYLYLELYIELQGVFTWGVTVAGQSASLPCPHSDSLDYRAEYFCQEQVILSPRNS
jgi:hypothetical protein